MPISAIGKVCHKRPNILIGGLMIAVLFGYVYHETFLWLYERYTNPDSHYSHGFLVPFISGYLVWKKRDELKSIEKKSTKIGLLLVLLAIAVHLGSVLAHIYFTSGFSIFLFVIGLSLYGFGENVTRKIAFPIGFLLFMFPLPIGVITYFSFPLKLFVAQIGYNGIKVMGIPLLREGVFIHLPNTSLSVGDPCSGIRSIFALMALGILIAYMSNMAVYKKAALFVSAVPIAIITNAFRVILLILAAYFFGGEWARSDHWFHMASGLGVFVLSMTLLLITQKALQ